MVVVMAEQRRCGPMWSECYEIGIFRSLCALSLEKMDEENGDDRGEEEEEEEG